MLYEATLELELMPIVPNVISIALSLLIFLIYIFPIVFFCFCFSLLSNYYNHSKRKDNTDLTILAEGELIAAKFKENWYRARVVNAAEDLVQVRISTFELKSRVE